MKGWAELKEAFWAVIEHGPGEKDRRAADLGAIDPALPDLLDALLAADAGGAPLLHLDDPAAPALPRPSRIGDYEVIDVLVGRLETVTAPFSQIAGWPIGGAVSRVDPDATAVGHREVGFELSFAAAWPPSDPDPDRHVAWIRAVWERLRPYSAGVYANFISDEGAAGVEAAYGARLRRLTTLKDRYDPTNVFRMNANIAPSRPCSA